MQITIEQVKDFTKMGVTKETVLEILNKYYNGTNPSSLEEEYNLAPGTISYFRKILKLPSYQNPTYSEENLLKASNEYLNGEPLLKTCEKYNISTCTLVRFMKNKDIYIKNGHGRKNHFNEDFFEVIDTEAKAYFLGFIYADGCINKTDNTQTSENRLIINISAKDIEIQYKFAEAINYKNPKINTYIPKGTYATNPMCRMQLNSKKLVSDLKKHGITSNKTNKISFPSTIPEHLINHFIRGFFDGDGSFTCTNKSNSFAIIGLKEILIPIQNILINKCNISQTKLRRYNNKPNIEIFDLVYGGKNSIISIGNYMYNNATIYLQRKYDKFSQIKNK